MTVVTVADIVQLSSALVSPVKHLISTTILVARQDQQKYPTPPLSLVTIVIVAQYANCLTVEVGNRNKRQENQHNAIATKIELAGKTAEKMLL